MGTLTLKEILNPVETGEETGLSQETKGMTLKEIAELCGVDQSTIWRWAKAPVYKKQVGVNENLLQNAKGLVGNPGKNAKGLADNPVQNADNLVQNAKGLAENLGENAAGFGKKIWLGISEKLEEAHKSGKDPAAFTLDETLAIIGEGGGNKVLAALLADNANPEKVVRRAKQFVRGSTWRYIERTGIVDNAARDVYKLKVKYQHSDKMSKQDYLRLFRCAIILHDYYYESGILHDELVLENTDLEEKLAVVVKRLTDVARQQVAGGAAPTIQSKEWWDGMWDYFRLRGYRREAIEEMSALEDKTGLNEDALPLPRLLM
jgi:hypothetical protein